MHASGKMRNYQVSTSLVALLSLPVCYLVLRYGASGKNEDTWDNKNLSVQIGFSKDILKTDHIWKTTGTVWTQLEMAS